MEYHRNEVHIIAHPAGHALSTDCWCEPSKIAKTVDPKGVPILLVEHRDDCQFHHKAVLLERTQKRDWITLFLDTIKMYPPHFFGRD